MKLAISQIAAAIGLLAIGTAAVADPISPNRPVGNYTSGTTDVFLAGSSAVDLALTKFIANSCLPGTLDTYRTDAGGKTYYLWTCEADGTGTTFNLASGNTKIAIHKNTNSSSDGVNYVGNTPPSTQLVFLQTSDLNGAATDCAIAPTVVPATATIPTYKVFACGTSAGSAGVGTLPSPVTFGFSDSEPKQFNTTAAAQITAVEPLTIIFGVPVTKNVRDLLQTSQGLTAGDESEAGMPSLSSAQLNGIFTGRYSTWTAAAGITGPGDGKVYMARRSAGSGTTRAFDVSFVGDFCVPGLTADAAATCVPLAGHTIASDCTATGSGGLQKTQLGTSDDMASCLNSYQANGGVGAIGYLSTDYQPATADNYRWIKVDGYSPKLLNVADGKWKDWSEESLNYNTAIGLAGDNLSFYNTIKTTSASGALVSEIAKNLPQSTSGMWTGGVMGALANSKNGAGWGLAAGASLTLPRTDASVLAYPANPLTRATTAGYSLCAPAFPASGYAAE